MKSVTLYTDGACYGNPGPGGYGVVLIFGRHRKELSGGFALTTNNRMEIMAAIVGLEALHEPCEVTLYTDSEYLANSINLGWARRWKAKGWMRNRKKQALNPDLWDRLLTQLDRHRVQALWVKGHAQEPENNRCDALAVQASQQPGLPPDTGYLEPPAPPKSLLL